MSFLFSSLIASFLCLYNQTASRDKLDLFCHVHIYLHKRTINFEVIRHIGYGASDIFFL